ncbi:cobalt/nickel transport protein [Rhizobium borbori]|uniref:Cobalt/nickel transport protein n=1 Tax=Allorhizobium borbori TaxID=485907 RepID=A0A7W6K673_9HYPH|nr:cobalt/nickel transport protein [Allorhizobium borbori]
MLPRPLLRSLLAAALYSAFVPPASAHFQEIIPSADVLPEGGAVNLDLVFTHPFEGGPVMDMKRPASVGVFAGGKSNDLTDRLVPASTDGATTWKLSYDLPEPGAAIFHVTPQPYWEPSEGKYIVHYAKVVVDSFASGEGWDEMVGLPVEIRPLTQPTAVWTGNIFSGVVTKAGKPVPFAKVEVEFINDKGIKAPNDAYITQVIKADANGTFNYAMPTAGWWGFAALLEADQPMKSPEGQDVPVEEGALIWVNAKPMGQ